MIFNIEQKIGKKEKAAMKDLYEDIQNPRLKKGFSHVRNGT